MSSVPKKIALCVLAAPAILNVMRKIALRKQPVTILCYHTLRSDHDKCAAWTALRMSDFHAQLSYLRNHYEIISLDHLDQPTTTGKPRAVITFDDGDIGLYRYLLPYLNRHPVPVTVYVATQQIKDRAPYWFDLVMNSALATKNCVVDLRTFQLDEVKITSGSEKERWLQISTILEALKTLDPDQRIDATKSVLHQLEGPAVDALPLGPMTIDHIEQLADHSFVTIGGHSHCHNLLDQIPIDQAQDSVVTNKSLLENWTGNPVRHFAYPNGNHTADLHQIVQSAGYETATILNNKLSSVGENKYALSRLAVGRFDELRRFKLRLAEI